MLRKIRVLVAEDDPELLRAVADALARLGAEVVQAETGGELIEKVAEQGPFALIVADVAMRWMNGIQAMHAIRNAGITTPTVMITALHNADLSERVRRIGGTTLLRKAFELSELASVAQALLESA